MARLTESEKQEIVRFFEADMQMPDKYLFVLFDEKRQVELVWNGKTNEVSPGTRKIPVKVVDIFGNDTLTIVTATVGRGR